jgi:hypothetical protein
MIRPMYRNEFEKDGLEKVRDNVLRDLYKNAEQQEQAKEWIEEKEGTQKRAFEHRLEIAVWLAVFLAFIAAFFSVATYFR